METSDIIPLGRCSIASDLHPSFLIRAAVPSQKSSSGERAHKEFLSLFLLQENAIIAQTMIFSRQHPIYRVILDDLLPRLHHNNASSLAFVAKHAFNNDVMLEWHLEDGSSHHFFGIITVVLEASSFRCERLGLHTANLKGGHTYYLRRHIENNTFYCHYSL